MEKTAEGLFFLTQILFQRHQLATGKESKCVRLSELLSAVLFAWYAFHSVKYRIIELVPSETLADAYQKSH